MAAEECRYAAEGYGPGNAAWRNLAIVSQIGMIWFLGFVVFAAIWLLSRPRR